MLHEPIRTVFRKNPPCFTLDPTIPVLSGTGCGPAKLSSEAETDGRACRWQRTWQRGQWEGTETWKRGDGCATASSTRKQRRQTSDDSRKFQALRAVREGNRTEQAEEEHRQELKTEVVQVTRWRCVWGDAVVYPSRRLTGVVTLKMKLACGCETRDSDCAKLREKQEATPSSPCC